MLVIIMILGMIPDTADTEPEEEQAQFRTVERYTLYGLRTGTAGHMEHRQLGFIYLYQACVETCR